MNVVVLERIVDEVKECSYYRFLVNDSDFYLIGFDTGGSLCYVNVNGDDDCDYDDSVVNELCGFCE